MKHGKTRTSRTAILLLASISAIVASPVLAADPWSERTVAIGAIAALPEGVLDEATLDRLTAVGEALFTAKFVDADGVGRPGATQAIIPTKRKHASAQMFFRTAGPDGGACASCHNEPVVGGAGDFAANVFVSEGFESANFDSLDPQFSNERGSNHLFGAGLIELLAREMSADLQAVRKAALAEARISGHPVRKDLVSKGVTFGNITASADGSVNLDGLDGVDTDLVIRPFSQKGVMTSLRQFTVNALNHHHGIQPDERFGARWTGTDDHDSDGVRHEMSEADVSALVAWQATLPAPVSFVPQNGGWPEAASRGETFFANSGCSDCHRPSLPLQSLEFADPGPYDAAGTLSDRDVRQSAIYDLGFKDWAKALPRDANGHVLVPLFGDLKRHVMTDNRIDALGNELLSQRFVDRNIFMTSELWGIASTAPYGHRNDFPTLDSIILAHGGAARAARDAYEAASETERSDLIAYLKTLVIKP